MWCSSRPTTRCVKLSTTPSMHHSHWIRVYNIIEQNLNIFRINSALIFKSFWCVNDIQVKTTLADPQFLFCDIVLGTLLAVVMGKGGPSKELHPYRPSASLLALPVLGSLLIHVIVIILGQLAVLFITTSQDWSVEGHKAQKRDSFIQSEYHLDTFCICFYIEYT